VKKRWPGETAGFASRFSFKEQQLRTVVRRDVTEADSYRPLTCMDNACWTTIEMEDFDEK
jgi:hypothetical protein